MLLSYLRLDGNFTEALPKPINQSLVPKYIAMKFALTTGFFQGFSPGLMPLESTGAEYIEAERKP